MALVWNMMPALAYLVRVFNAFLRIHLLHHRLQELP